MTTREGFKKRLADSAPAPHGETPEYNKFTSIFTPIALGLAVATAYATTLLMERVSVGASVWLSGRLPMLQGRMAFLEAADGYSHIPYTATILSGFALLPLMLVANGIGYWNAVVSRRQCNAVSTLTLFVMTLGCVVLGVFLWIAFLDVPASYDPRWPGMAKVLLWPVFPALGASAVYLVSVVMFSVLVGILKFVFLRGGHSGRHI